MHNKGHSMINLTLVLYGSKALVTQLIHSMGWMSEHSLVSIVTIVSI